jgi:hypothetical protein
VKTLYAFCCTAVLLAALAPAAAGDDKPADLTPKQFRRVATALLEDPLAEKAPDLARLVIYYTMETSSASVVLGEEELTWIAKDDPRSLVLFAAYLAGNVQSQHSSGVQRNDRYSGLLGLFQAYRLFREKDKEFQVKEVDELLKLHQDDKLLAHLAGLEKKKPPKLTAEQEARLREMMKPKKP